MKWGPVLALLAVAALAGCASSSTRLVGPARPPISPAEVRVYRTAPLHYREIAVLDATSGARFFHGSPEGEADRDWDCDLRFRATLSGLARG